MTQKPDPGNSQAQLGAELGAGMQFAITIALCTYGGWWLDARWETSPLLLFGGCLIGAVGGFYQLYRTLVGETPNSDHKQKEAREETP